MNGREMRYELGKAIYTRIGFQKEKWTEDVADRLKKGFEEGKSLEEYDIADFVSERINYEKRLYSDENTYIITGHTPTPAIRKDKKPLIYKENGHIAIDCACVFGGRLAAYCLDTEEVTYVEAKPRQEEELDF